MTHIGPIWIQCITPWVTNRYGGNKVVGWTYDKWRVNDAWMNPKEIHKSKIKTYYPLESVILTLDHVNGVKGLGENKVMDNWQDMMIKSLIDINIGKYTLMKC